MEIKTYQDLLVWKNAKELSIMIYKITREFPKEEMFGITNQLRRAVISISNNIAEGIGRQYKKDTLQFLFISNGSLNEVENMTIISQELGYIDYSKSIQVQEKITDTRKLLKGFIKYYQQNSLLK